MSILLLRPRSCCCSLLPLALERYPISKLSGTFERFVPGLRGTTCVSMTPCSGSVFPGVLRPMSFVRCAVESMVMPGRRRMIMPSISSHNLRPLRAKLERTLMCGGLDVRDASSSWSQIECYDLIHARVLRRDRPVMIKLTNVDLLTKFYGGLTTFLVGLDLRCLCSFLNEEIQWLQLPVQNHTHWVPVEAVIRTGESSHTLHVLEPHGGRRLKSQVASYRKPNSPEPETVPVWSWLVDSVFRGTKSVFQFLYEQPGQLQHIEWPPVNTVLRMAILTLTVVTCLIVLLATVDSTMSYVLASLLRRVP